MRLLRGIAAALLLSGQIAAADPHPMRLENHPFNGSVLPETKDGITRFEILNQECSSRPYGDGRGESDCQNGNVRSNLTAHTAGASETWTYEFEFRIPEPVNYAGWYNSHACGFLDACMDSRLRIASWEGNRLHNLLYMLKLDGRTGVRFLNETCVKPQQLADWTRFRLEVRWSADDRGWIRVSCDDRIIHFREGVRTAAAPHCYITNLCRDGETKRPSRVLTILGPVMQGFGPEWKMRGKPHQFTDFSGPVVVEMRNVLFAPGGELYGAEATAAVLDLQRHLSALGCDPGPIDGVMGRRTCEAALECRDVAADLPEQINAETVFDWVSAYRAAHPL